MDNIYIDLSVEKEKYVLTSVGPIIWWPYIIDL